MGVVIDGHESIGYFSTGLASSTFSVSDYSQIKVAVLLLEHSC